MVFTLPASVMPARKGSSRAPAIALPTEAPLSKKDGAKASPVTVRLAETVESLQRSLELLTLEKEQLLLRQHILHEICTATEYAVVIFRTYGPELEGLLHSGLQSATTVLVANLEQQITMLQRALQAAGSPEQGQLTLDPFQGIPEALGRTKGPGGALTLLQWGLSLLQENASAYSGLRQLDASSAHDLIQGAAVDYAVVLRDLDAAEAAGDAAAAAAAEARIAGYLDGGHGPVVGAVMHLIQPLFTWALGEGACTEPLLLSTSQPWLHELVAKLGLTKQQRAAMAAAGRVYQQLLAPLVEEQATLKREILVLLQRMEDNSMPPAERRVDHQLQEATLVQLQGRLQAAAAAASLTSDSDPATPNIIWLPGLRQHQMRAMQQQQQQQQQQALPGLGFTHRPSLAPPVKQEQQQQQRPQLLPGPELHEELLKLVQRSQVVLWRQSWLENCELWHMYALLSWRQFARYHAAIAGHPVHAGMLHAFVALQDAAANAPPIKVKPGGAGRRASRSTQQALTSQEPPQQQEQTLGRAASDPGSSGSSSGGGTQMSSASTMAGTVRAAAREGAGLVVHQPSINSGMQLLNAGLFGASPPPPLPAAALAAAATSTTSPAPAAAALQQPQLMDAWPPAPPAAAAPVEEPELLLLPQVGSSPLPAQQQAGQGGGEPGSAAGSRDMSMSSGGATTGSGSGHSRAAAAGQECAAGTHPGLQPQPAASDSLPQSLFDLLWGPEVDADLDVTSGAPWGGG